MIFALAIFAVSALPPSSMRPVTEGTKDVTPLARDLSAHSRDLRKPTGFENIYEVTRPDGRRPAFARVHGALVAEFPRSEYIPTEYGEMATVPAGTRYRFLRTPMPVDEGALTPARRATSLSVDGLRPAPEPSVVLGAGADSMWQSEQVRRDRVASLLSKI